MSKFVNQALVGIAGGILATLPMTVALMAMQHLLPGKKSREIPPLEIAENALSKVQADKTLDDGSMRVARTLVHYSYGAFSAIFFLPLLRRLPLPAAVKGLLYGFGTWAINYNGVVPALGLYPHAKDEPPAVNFMMFMSHLIWGSVTGIAATLLYDMTRKRLSTGKF